MSLFGPNTIHSLRSSSEWINLIAYNINNTQQVAYKGTKVMLSDGVSRQAQLDEIPRSDLTISATYIDWEQGQIYSSTENVHFGINGRGFFVLQDDRGYYYLTRDGEFHWDENGYLVDSAGLKVLSKNQDFIRIDSSDISDTFTNEGISEDLTKYGNKTLMIVNVANTAGLMFSQYGSTTYKIEGDIPFRIENDFSETLDGLTPYYTGNFAIVPTYTHDKTNGWVVSGTPLSGGRLSIGESGKFTNFKVDFETQITAGGNWTGIMFGQTYRTDDFNNSGYSVRLLAGGVVEIRDYNNTLIASSGLPNPLIDPSIGVMRKVSISVNNSTVYVSVDGINVLTASLPDIYITGYLSLRNENNTVIFDNLTVTPFERRYDTTKTGPIYGNCANDIQTTICPRSLEASNAPIFEYLPLLALAQKIFAAIAKVILVYNSVMDDMHSTIR